VGIPVTTSLEEEVIAESVISARDKEVE
jgi:hypothetical protein